MTRIASRAHRAEIVALAIAIAAVIARAQGDEYTRGDMQFSVGNQHYQLPLDKVPGASSRVTVGTGKILLGLVYTSEERQGPVEPDVHFALIVGGPGKYGKSAIMNFVVQTGLNPWTFSSSKDDCVFDLTRVDKSRVEGTVTCTTTVPFTGMRFSATP